MNNYHNEINNKGYAVIPRLIPVELVNQAINSIKISLDFLLSSLGLKVGRSLEESMEILYRSDIEKYKNFCSVIWRKIEISDICNHLNIRDFICKNFGWENIFLPGGQVFHIMSKKLEIPNGYFGFSAHQDWNSVKGSLDGLVVWIPLVDIDSNKYPLEILRGSNRRGLFEPKVPSNESQSWEIELSDEDEKNFESIEVKAGDVVLMTYFTVHRSKKHGGDTLRLACSTRYDNGGEKTFIERCYPSAYVRSVQR